ncbi:hypothetical protein HMPREF9374_1503 [Desmospora sp. 8437]|nr:hypothetical protein HMPREF9374_1503 [Desmospora sp. 8437]
MGEVPDFRELKYNAPTTPEPTDVYDKKSGDFSQCFGKKSQTQR